LTMRAGDSTPITGVAGLAAGDVLTTRLAKGNIRSEVIDARSEEGAQAEGSGVERES